MTPVELATYIRKLTRTNTSTFSDADILGFLNVSMDDLSEQILHANEDYFLIPTTTDLVADQREYPIPDENMGEIKRVEAAFDPTLPLVYIPLKELDITGYKFGSDDATVATYYTNNAGEAYYDISRRAITLYAGDIPDVTNGLRLWSFQYPEHLTALDGTADLSLDPSTTSFGFPRQFHELLGRKVSILWKSSRDKPIPLTEQERVFEPDLARKLNTIRQLSLDRQVLASVPYNDGSQY